MILCRHDLQTMAEDLNGIVDEIIEDLDNFMIQTGLDPTELEEIHEGFEFVINSNMHWINIIYHTIFLISVFSVH